MRVGRFSRWRECVAAFSGAPALRVCRYASLDAMCVRVICAHGREGDVMGEMGTVPEWTWHVWSCNGHRFVSCDSSEGAVCESCLTCGGHWELTPDESGTVGYYVSSAGEPADECSGRTDMVHGYAGERVCEADNGRPCEANRETGTCPHVDHECNCVQCS